MASKNRLALATACILMASFMTVLNTNMLRIASPHIMAQFGVSVAQLTWIFNGYMLPYSVLMPICGRLGDTTSRKFLFQLGLVIFAGGSLLASFTWSYWALVSFRVVQAIGAACVFPNALVMATNLHPPERRGTVLGLLGATASLGAVIGPTVGGFLIEYLHWNAIFYVNIPVAVILLVTSMHLLKEIKQEEQRKETFDYAGSVTLSVALLGLVVVLVNGTEWGWLSWRSLIFIAASSSVAALFFRVEVNSASPLVDLDLLRNRLLQAGIITGLSQMLCMQASNFLIPLFLAEVKMYPPATIGMLMLPAALVRLVASPASGVMADRYGSQFPVVLGLVIKVVTFFMLSRLNPLVTAVYVAAMLVANAIGSSLMWSPTLSAVLSSSPQDRAGSVTGIFNMVRFLGGMVGTTIAGVILNARYHLIEPGRAVPAAGYHESYLLLVAVSLATLPIAMRLGRTPKVSTAAAITSSSRGKWEPTVRGR